MKKTILAISIATFLMIGVGCGNDQPTPLEQQKVEAQVAKDQAAQDSMEKVIMEQIGKEQTDSLAIENRE